mmetsp:Transcript_44535/g.65528  ORF Transcript_44535/g.65528 Transcript_44535/m.65528 type:complete len:98 (+) Transcript_44535:235-528(+)
MVCVRTQIERIAPCERLYFGERKTHNISFEPLMVCMVPSATALDTVSVHSSNHTHITAMTCHPIFACPAMLICSILFFDMQWQGTNIHSRTRENEPG